MKIPFFSKQYNCTYTSFSTTTTKHLFLPLFSTQKFNIVLEYMNMMTRFFYSATYPFMNTMKIQIYGLDNAFTVPAFITI